MMRRFLGWLCLALAVAALAADIWRGPVSGAPLAFASLAEHWAELHRPSLIGLNSFTEKTLSPALWDSLLLPALTLPSAAVFAALAALFFILSLFRRERGGRTFSKRRR